MSKPWRVLLVEDNSADAQDAAKRITNWKFSGDTSLEVELCVFGDAKTMLATRRYDLAIFDLIDDNEDGWAIGNGIKPKEEEPELAGNKLLNLVRSTRALPIVFHTAHPDRLEITPSIIGKVVTKGDWSLLHRSIDEIIKTRIPELLRRIEDALRDYLWEFVEKHSCHISSNPNEAAILLARRLSFLLRKETLNQIGHKNHEAVQAAEYYIYPRVDGDPQVGDIYTQGNGADAKYFLLLTPSCDMVAGRIKAEKALLVPCAKIHERSAYKDWKANPDKPIGKSDKTTTTDILLAWIRGRQPQEDRNFFLPPAFDIPALLCDFQHCVTIDFKALANGFHRVATLDSPFSEAVAARFARYFGRLGTPDLDLETTLKKL